jgi:hypothetical protein
MKKRFPGRMEKSARIIEGAADVAVSLPAM